MVVDLQTYDAREYRTFGILFAEGLLVPNAVLNDHKGAPLIDYRSQLLGYSVLIQGLGCADDVIVLACDFGRVSRDY